MPETKRKPQGHARLNAEKRECYRGHPFNKANTHRYANGNRACRACMQISHMRGNMRKLMANPERLVGSCLRKVSLPAGPMLAILPVAPPVSLTTGLDGYAQMGGVSALFADDPKLDRGIYRARRLGKVSPLMADEVCCKVGINPANVYGRQWECATSCPLFWRVERGTT